MNKNIKLIALLSFISLAGFAQVGIGTTTPDASSALDITATDKGFLMPRMTTVQRTAIASPVIGLQAYDTDTKSVWTFDGTIWKEGAGGAGKFIDGVTPDIAYYDGKVGIGINAFSDAHKLYVKGLKTTDEENTAARIDAEYNGTGTSAQAFGLASFARNLGTGTVNFAVANRPIIENVNASGTINTAVGAWPQVGNAGTMSFVAGLFSSVNNFGTITQVDGVGAIVFNSAGSQIDSVFINYQSLVNNGTVNRVFGSYLDFQGIGTVTDSYALYINDNFNKGTNDNFAIYSISDADSYLVGNVGVGIAAPQQKVHISGAMRLEPQATAPAGGKGDLYAGTDNKLYFHNGTEWKEVQLGP